MDKPEIIFSEYDRKLWLQFYCAAITGLAARTNTRFTPADISGVGGLVADDCLKEYKLRTVNSTDNPNRPDGPKLKPVA